MTRRLMTLLRDTRGATAVEYGLVVALIVLSMVVGLSSAANSVINMWNGVSNKVTSAS